MKNSTIFLAFIFSFVAVSFGQETCLTKEESQKIVDSIQSVRVLSENKNLRKEIFSIQDNQYKLQLKISKENEEHPERVTKEKELSKKNLLRVCQILKENGWLTKHEIGENGVEALAYIIITNIHFDLQRQLLPVVMEAGKKQLIDQGNVAFMIDTLRISVDLPQIFGTKAYIKDDIVYLYPLSNDKMIDKWREEYSLEPLPSFIRYLENLYSLPVIKMSRMISPPESKKKDNDKEKILIEKYKNDIEKDLSEKAIGLSEVTVELEKTYSLPGTLNAQLIKKDDEKIYSKPVDLNVRVFNKDLTVPKGLELKKEDFVILDEGKQQDIEYVSSTDNSFDIVLLLDFRYKKSYSNFNFSITDNRNLIKKNTRTFIDYARPNDRIAVVAFGQNIDLISNLTSNKTDLIEKIYKIDAEGDSPVWNSVEFTYENVIKKENVGRRSAIIFLTNATDSSGQLVKVFADALDTAKKNNATIFPIYLGNDYGGMFSVRKTDNKFTKMLSMLAEETGGEFYKAVSVNNLSEIYQKIINDLGRVYSIGYSPKNVERDGVWRKLEVKIKNREDLVVKSKKGYYAK